MTPRSSIILFAHGARDPEWAAPFERIAARLREARPNLAVQLAFLELMQPALGDAVAGMAADGITRITLVPLFLAQGGHLKEDLPRLLDDIRRSHPGVTIEVTQAIGESEVLTAAIADWALTQHLSFTT
ncbi:MAG TPA: CbiX/SirB N-terminal domain-containing protein [Burkholderiales bacterium]|jgi:sirohydrochlorin cobaltochelatase|nr:CbiX/SirB N-terminal domain-containing protein [Burkholderiales bacterium]